MNENIPDMIRKARKEAKLTQRELAKHLGVSQQTIANWENGKAHPDITKILQLSRILGTTVQSFIGGVGPTTSYTLSREEQVEIGKFVPREHHMAVFGRMMPTDDNDKYGFEIKSPNLKNMPLRYEDMSYKVLSMQCELLTRYATVMTDADRTFCIRVMTRAISKLKRVRGTIQNIQKFSSKMNREDLIELLADEGYDDSEIHNLLRDCDEQDTLAKNQQCDLGD